MDAHGTRHTALAAEGLTAPAVQPAPPAATQHSNMARHDVSRCAARCWHFCCEVSGLRHWPSSRICIYRMAPEKSGAAYIREAREFCQGHGFYPRETAECTGKGLAERLRRATERTLFFAEENAELMALKQQYENGGSHTAGPSSEPSRPSAAQENSSVGTQGLKESS